MNFTGPITNHVAGQGRAPDAFLTELLAWGSKMLMEIYAPNGANWDIFNRLYGILGLEHRRAALLELMRVLAGFESSWNWNEGVDTTNKLSMENINGQETGAWQVSFDSLGLQDMGSNNNLRACVVAHCRVVSVDAVLVNMKINHVFAMEYAARLLRNSFRWDGPVLRHEVDQWLSRDSVDQIRGLLLGSQPHAS